MEQIRETKGDLFYLAIYYTDSSKLTQVSTQALPYRPCIRRTKKLISIEGTSAYEDLHSINPEINLAASSRSTCPTEDDDVKEMAT